MSSEFQIEKKKIINSVGTTDSSVWTSNLSLMRSSLELSDFKFIVDGKEFLVHRVFLSAQSSFFREIFSSKTVEIISDISIRSFSMLLDFIYTGKLPQEIFLSDVFDLLSASVRFGIDLLKSYTKKVLIGFIRRCPTMSMHVFKACYYTKAPWEVTNAVFKMINK